MGHPTIHPTSTTVYNPDKAWNGYTVFQAAEHGAVVIDMNGNVQKLWKDFQGEPIKLLPGGYLLGSSGERNTEYGYQDLIDLVQIDWEGNIVWKFNHLEYIEDPGYEAQWMLRQHHDYQRTGNPVGYYVPKMETQTLSGNTMILCHHNVVNHKISDKLLLDDCIIEVDWQGNILWRWNCNEHFKEFGFDEAAKNALFRDPNKTVAGGDWMHINSMSLLGPNKWYDEGDERFHPDNIICDARESNIMFIISKKTGKITWKLGPNIQTRQEKFIGQIIGQHHCHMIPRGLPGEGNILLFDNGGWSGYGVPCATAPTGHKIHKRDYTRVLEINPVTMKIVWQCTPSEMGHLQPFHSHHFYSPFISSAQRLPNGNTLITEGSDGRIIEITKDHELVWEYISPFWGSYFPLNMIYRAYRYPYEWIPQLPTPQEIPIEKIDNTCFYLPNAGSKEPLAVAHVQGTIGYHQVNGFCVQTEEPIDLAKQDILTE